MAKISASVGRHDGKQCFNVLSDQQTIRDLLNAIPTASGGCDGATALTGPILWGVVSPSMHQAILSFQRHNHLSVDGHIDPNGGALKLMNRLLPDLPMSESGPAESESPLSSAPGSVLPICGPMRVVKAGHVLPASIDVQGGPVGEFSFTELFGLITIETTIFSPFSAVEVHTLSAKSPVGLLTDIGMPPPVHWSLKIRSKAAPVGVVNWQFRTDWSPGSPRCRPR